MLSGRQLQVSRGLGTTMLTTMMLPANSTILSSCKASTYRVAFTSSSLCFKMKFQTGYEQAEWIEALRVPIEQQQADPAPSSIILKQLNHPSLYIGDDTPSQSSCESTSSRSNHDEPASPSQRQSTSSADTAPPVPPRPMHTLSAPAPSRARPQSPLRPSIERTRSNLVSTLPVKKAPNNNSGAPNLQQSSPLIVSRSLELPSQSAARHTRVSDI